MKSWKLRGPPEKDVVSSINSKIDLSEFLGTDDYHMVRSVVRVVKTIRLP